MNQFMIEIRPDVAVVITVEDGKVQVACDERVTDEELMRVQRDVQAAFEKGRIKILGSGLDALGEL